MDMDRIEVDNILGDCIAGLKSHNEHARAAKLNKVRLFLSYRPECWDCNHNPVCREDLKTSLEGDCPFYDPKEKK